MKTNRILRIAATALALIFTGLSYAADVTWTGSDTTWDQPDSDSFDATYNSGDNVTFGGTGVGAVTVGAGVTPGTITFNHATGTYTFSGTAFNAGANALTISGAGIVQFGNMTNAPYTPTWGATSISGGGSLYYTRGTNIGSSGSTITLNNGHLRVGADNSATYNYDNPITIGAGGGSLTAQWTGNAPVFYFTGGITGSGALTLRNAGNSQNYRGAPGLRLGGTNSGFTGAAVISSTATQMNQYGSGMITFGSSANLLSNASSVTVRDGGVMGFSYAVASGDLSNVVVGPRGGIGATGANGSLTNLTNPMSYVGPGGILILDNQNALNNDRIGDSASLALNNNRMHIIGRNASNNQTNETAGDMTFSGGSLFSIDRPNNTDSGVKLTVSSLATASAGNTLLLQWDNLGTTAALNDLIVTGTKPTVTNGMITPGIQHYTSGNILGNFLTFDGDNLVSAFSNYTTYTTDWSGAASTEIVNATATITLTAGASIHALRFDGGDQNLGGFTVNLGSGGLIMSSRKISNGTLNFGSTPGFIGAYNAASQANIDATIAGSGGITAFGTSQSLNLNVANTFTGGLFVNGGLVHLRHVSAANGNDVTVNALGRLAVGTGNATNPVVIGGLSGDGRVSGHWQTNGNYHLRISPSSGTYTFNGTVYNHDASKILHIQKSGNGIQVFSADSVGTYTGTTSVNAGTLLIHGDFSAATGAVTVAGGATLGGTGIIGGDTTTSASTSIIAPGASVGKLTFNQNLDFASGATLKYELGSAATAGTTSDLILVNGALTGSTSAGALQFEFTALSGFQTGTPYRLIQFGSASGLDYTDLDATVLPNGNPLDTSYGTGGWNITSDALYVQFIPEPSTVSVLLGAGAMLLIRRRLRRA